MLKYGKIYNKLIIKYKTNLPIISKSSLSDREAFYNFKYIE